MPRRPILSPRHGFAGNAAYPVNAIRHDVVFPGLGERRATSPGVPSGSDRESLEREVRETEFRLDHLLEEKRTLERKREELNELNEKQSLCRERRDKLVDEVHRTITELQKNGHFEVRRGDALERTGTTVRRLRLSLETLRRLELKDPSEWPRLAEGLRLLKDAEAELEDEMARLEGVEASAPATYLFASEAPQRRGFLGWMRLGFSFFLPVLVLGLLGVIIVVAFFGVN